MSKLKNIALLLAILLLGFTTANAGASFSINLGSDGYYEPVGDYDYLPYAYQTDPGYAAPAINFREMMSQYGTWVNVASFGQVWKPYASDNWQPYTYGHWITTQQYGQMWEGYEPWAWAGYHYGNWVFDRNYGWVWIPGYDWHPGRVTWARSYDSIGWMPSPPNGYDYSRGYLSNVGPNNQFGYNDSNFGMDYGYGNFNQGGPYSDPGYRDMYYNPGYNQVLANLWIFIANSNFGNDNYSNYYLGPNYTQQVFDRRLLRISNRQMDRLALERVVGQRLRETQVEVRQLQADKKSIRVVVPTGRDAVDRVRKNSKEVVRDIIAPGFAEKQKPFMGQNSKNKQMVSKIFNQENVKPKVETLSSEQVISQARKANQNREQNRIKIEQVEKGKLDRIAKEELQEPGKDKTNLKGGQPESQLQKEDQEQKDVVKQKEQEAELQSDVAKQTKREVQKQNDVVEQKEQEAQMQNDSAEQKERDVQKQKDVVKQKEQEAQQQSDVSKQTKREVQKQNDVVEQREHETQVQNEAEKQQQMESEQKKAPEKDSVQQPQTNTSKESEVSSQQDSKNKKSKAKKKDKDKPQQEQQPPPRGRI